MRNDPYFYSESHCFPEKHGSGEGCLGQMRLPGCLPSPLLGWGSACPTLGQGLYLCSCLCLGLNSLWLQPAGTRGTWKGFGDQVGQNVREVQKIQILKFKFYAPQKLTGFTCLSLLWPSSELRALSAKMRFQVPTKFRGYSILVCAHF